MSITRLTTNGLTGTKYDTVSADNYYMEPIATTLLASSQATISFTNIPQGYKNLQIRAFARTTRAGGNSGDYGKITFNSDSGSNYSMHVLSGDGSSAGAGATANSAFIEIQRFGDSGSSIVGTAIIDILDYSNVYKFKTLRSLGGVDYNGSGYIMLNSGLWMNTSAITSLTLVPNIGPNWAQYSRFSLYGIKG